MIREAGAAFSCATVLLGDLEHVLAWLHGSISASVKCSGGTGLSLRLQ